MLETCDAMAAGSSGVAVERSLPERDVCADCGVRSYGIQKRFGKGQPRLFIEFKRGTRGDQVIVQSLVNLVLRTMTGLIGLLGVGLFT